LIARLATYSQDKWPHIMYFAETWFNKLSYTTIPGYQLHRTDRGSRAGGVAIYIKNGITATDVKVAALNSGAIEQIWRIIRVGEESLLIGCIYRPHDFDDVYLSKTIESISAAKTSLVDLNCSTMLLYGDFNLSHTLYEDADVGGGVATIAHVANERAGDVRFQSCLDDCHLTQLVTFPTYRKHRLARST
jgi:hypothetical protein